VASFIYNSCIEDLSNNNIDFGADTFKLMLVTSSYTANKDTHDKRDDVTNEVADGNGYTTGGATTACTVTKDTANDKVTLAFAAVNWATATFTARGGVIYKSRGGASSADELVAYIDFGGDVSATSATFSVGASTITLQN
jgi:hypothetical protein